MCNTARAFRVVADQSGLAIVTMVFALLLVSVLGLAAAFCGMLEVQSSHNYQDTVTSLKRKSRVRNRD